MKNCLRNTIKNIPSCHFPSWLPTSGLVTFLLEKLFSDFRFAPIGDLPTPDTVMAHTDQGATAVTA